MELFKNLSALLTDDVTASVTIKHTTGGKMFASVVFTAPNGALSTLAPISLKGTPEELDEGFIAAITEPCQTVTGLVVDKKAFDKSAKEAAKKPSTASTTSAEAAEAKKKQDKAAKLVADLMKEAEAASKGCLYNTAAALAEHALTMATAVTKASLTDMVKKAKEDACGLLCGDTPEEAAEALGKWKEKHADKKPSEEAEEQASSEEVEPEND